MHALKNPRKRRNIPLNLVKPSKHQKSKRVRIDHVSGTLPMPSAPDRMHPQIEDLLQAGSGLEAVDGDISDNEPDFYESADSVQLSITASSHTKRKEKAAAKWDEIHQTALTVMIEESSLPSDIKCFVCGIESATVRCLHCGPQHFFCEKCGTDLHSHALYHHCPELWRDGCYVPLDLPTPLIVEMKHNCTDISRRVITCFHSDGIPRKISFPFCACESDCIKLIRFHYWPATSSKPLIAFTFHFLDWLEALLLECQVAVQDMTQAISYLIRDKIGQMPCQLYPVLIDSFEEYRHAKYRLRSLESILATPLKSSCPACPKSTGTITIAIDALFGLCRKKSAGTSVRNPLSNSRMFESQSEVNAFVDGYSYAKTTSPKGCNNFLAGDVLRSKTRFKALDETGVMGAVCRHEVPIRFFNLHHGERISYAVFLMKKLKDQFPNHDVQLMYDVACLLHKHIQAHQELKNEFRDFYSLAIPIFHCYGHKLQCQIQFGPRNLEGFGLSDGEGMERLWSYLRRFSRMTKEMRPSHRIDVLTDSLVYYAQKSISNIDTILVKRLQRAQKAEGESYTKLQELMTSSAGSITMEDVELWLKDETSNLSLHSNSNDTATLTWQEEYVRNIEVLLKLREEIEKVGDDDSSACDKIDSQILLTEKKLKNTETKHHVAQRWEPESVQYQIVRKTFTMKTRSNLLIKIKDLARERWVLLALKAKYADGLALACRLAKRITAVSTQIKKIIACYNELEGEPLTWQSAIDLHACIPGQESSGSVSCEVKRQAIGHLRLQKRAGEEIHRIKAEMANCLTFYHDKIQQLEEIQQQLASTCPLSRLNIGSINLVKKQLFCDRKRLVELQHAFSKWLTTENHPLTTDPNPSPSLPSPFEPSSTQFSFLRESPGSPVSQFVRGKSPTSSELLPYNLPNVSYSSQLRGDTQYPTLSMQSTDTDNRSNDILSSTISDHPGPSLSLSSSMITVCSPSTTVSTQPPLKGPLNFTSSSSPFMPRWFLVLETRNEQMKKTGGSTHTETPRRIESDPTGDYLSKSSTTSLLNEPTEHPMSIRVPDAKVKPHLVYSGDEESSDDEEPLPKQSWRAERFHMEEFLREMRAEEPLTLDMLFPESEKISITTTKQPVAAVMRPASFLKKQTVIQS